MRFPRGKISSILLIVSWFLQLIFGLAEPQAATDAGGKLEKSGLVLAYPQPSGVFTLQDVLISSLSTGSANVNMALESSRPAEVSE